MPLTHANLAQRSSTSRNATDLLVGAKEAVIRKEFAKTFFSLAPASHTNSNKAQRGGAPAHKVHNALHVMLLYR